MLHTVQEYMSEKSLILLQTNFFSDAFLLMNEDVTKNYCFEKEFTHDSTSC